MNKLVKKNLSQSSCVSVKEYLNIKLKKNKNRLTTQLLMKLH